MEKIKVRQENRGFVLPSHQQNLDEVGRRLRWAAECDGAVNVDPKLIKKPWQVRVVELAAEQVEVARELLSRYGRVNGPELNPKDLIEGPRRLAQGGCSPKMAGTVNYLAWEMIFDEKRH